MYGHYEYSSHHIVGGSSSQPNIGGSSSQPNIGGSSSQPNIGGSSSPVRHFNLDDDDDYTQMYSSQFSESFREEQSPTPEEETALCKGWVRISEDSVKGNARKKRGFWIEILKYMHETCPITQRQTYDMVNEKWKTVLPKVATFCGVYGNTILMYTIGAGDANYLQRAMTNYHAEYGVPITLLHCWEMLKECDKWSSGEVSLFMQEKEEGKNKRYKSSGSSSFNTKESGEGSINLNTTIGDEEENKVEEVRRPRPMGRDQAKRKMKAGSASSASSFDVEALAKMMANEYVMASDSYNIQKNQEMSELLKIKKQELKLKAAELEI
ncbi:RNA-directed DNA polymerase, eukaryota [Tanacetum coccineum]